MLDPIITPMHAKLRSMGPGDVISVALKCTERQALARHLSTSTSLRLDTDFACYAEAVTALMQSDNALAVGASFECGIGHICGARFFAGFHRRAKAEYLVVLMRAPLVTATDTAEEDPS
jgi:hypothetical protein